MNSDSYDALKYMLEYEKRLPKLPVGASYPLPNHRRLSYAESVSSMNMEQYGDEIMRRLKINLASRIANDVINGGSLDLEVRETFDTRETTIVSSCYVFNEVQMREFIREVEDAVKESLST